MESINNSLQGNLTHQLITKGAGVGLGKNEDKPAKDGVGNVLGSFGDILGKQMNQINTLQQQADEAVQTYAVGGDIELHNVIMATDKAEMSLQLATQVRNRLLAAYQEISRMNV